MFQHCHQSFAENPQVTEPPWKEAIEVNDLKQEKTRDSQPYEQITEKPKLRNRNKYRGYTTTTTNTRKYQQQSGLTITKYKT